MAKTSAREKMARKKQTKTVVLEYDYGGMKAGDRMFIATPKIVDSYIRAIPEGQHRTVEGMRRELARRHKCASSCPMSTAIFVRLSAEVALEDIANGEPQEAAPFWRLLRGSDKIAKRLDLDENWIDQRRAAEGIRA